MKEKGSRQWSRIWEGEDEKGSEKRGGQEKRQQRMKGGNGVYRASPDAQVAGIIVGGMRERGGEETIERVGFKAPTESRSNPLSEGEDCRQHFNFGGVDSVVN